MIQNNKYQIIYNLTGGASDTKKTKNILLDGTSSSGKSSICKILHTQLEYECQQLDYVWQSKDFEKFYGQEYNKLPNDYVTSEFKKNVSQIIIAQFILQLSLKTPKMVIDWVIPKFIIQEFKKNKEPLFVILVYAGLEKLSQNMIARKAELDPRKSFVFTQFSERVIKTDKKEEIIDKVNRKNFKQILLDNFKMNFTSLKDLEEFCNSTFKKMEIEDDKDHGIKIRPEYKYDYLLNTNGKSKDEVIEEVISIIL
ncbi:hypothetical protein CPAV1605_858 [seawater metagenome]|uniref:Uncharacterized protein n=1 Tax=seawater metagenome TaxID=1561972 RepID=A0A5E8CIB5_9ZZZZ